MKQFRKISIMVCLIIMSIFEICLADPRIWDTQNSTLSISSQDKELVIMSWNIRYLGITKVADPIVLKTIVHVLSQADIIAIQEVRDKTGKALKSIEIELDKLGEDYSYITSSSLGRGSYKEQYAYFYRTAKASLKHEETTLNEKISRPPYVAVFTVGGQEITLLNIHIDPNAVGYEVDELSQIANGYKGNVITLGDFNYDCSYMNEDKTVGFNEKYVWTITNDMDTNVSNSDCTYDRIIVTTMLMKYYKWAEPFVWSRYFDYSVEPKNVSDHWPVILMLNL